MADRRQLESFYRTVVDFLDGRLLENIPETGGLGQS